MLTLNTILTLVLTVWVSVWTGSRRSLPQFPMSNVNSWKPFVTFFVKKKVLSGVVVDAEHDSCISFARLGFSVDGKS